MSEKTRHDKDGQDQNKANQAMHRHEETGYIPGEGRHKSDSEVRDAMDRADFDRDLRPHEFAGNNSGQDDPQPNGRNAYEFKDLHEKFPQLSSSDLKSLAILPLGTPLEQGATYIDLNRLEEGEFKARADFQITETNLLVAKNSVDYELWDRLRGHGERVDQDSVGKSSGQDDSTDNVPNERTAVDESKVGA
ncbi:MAG TPA: hypothetical protein VF627_07770 [Abditibacterium sp.]|jgi:hypothetical protein